MNTIKASEAKIHFGELLLKAQTEPVEINKNGKPVAVMISSKDYQEIESLKMQLLKLRAQKANESITNNQLIDGSSFMKDLLAKHNN